MTGANMAQSRHSPRTSSRSATTISRASRVSRWPCRKSTAATTSTSLTSSTPGWAILDVTDPAKPEYLKFVPGPDQPGPGHAQDPGGRRPHDHGPAAGTLPFLHGTEWGDPFEEGVIIWDVKDPVNPKKLSRVALRAAWAGCTASSTTAAATSISPPPATGFRGFIYRDPRHRRPQQPGGGGPVVDARPVAGRPDAAAAGRRRSAAGMLDGADMHGPPIPRATWPT